MTKRAVFLIAAALAAQAAWCQTAPVIRTVEVRGNRAVNSDAIKAAMTRIATGKLYNAQDADADEEAILNLGFFRDVQIVLRDISATEADVIVDVAENPLINEFRILGNTVVSTEKLTDIAKNVQTLGKIWNNKSAAAIRDAISAEYRKHGTFVQLLALEPDRDTPGALLISILEPKVGEITFEGLGRTRPSTVKRMIKTKPGEVFKLQQWQDDLLELWSSQWFEKLEPDPPAPTDQPGVFNLRAKLAETRTAQIGAGVALDPQSRLVGTAFYTDTNFKGLGKSVGLNLSQSAAGGGPSAELAYTDRFADERGTSVNAQLFSKVVYNFVGTGTDAFGTGGINDFNERRTGFSYLASRPFGKDHRFGAGITAQNIRTIQLKDNLDSSEFIQQDGDLAYLQFNFDIDKRRPTTEPVSGSFLRFQVEPGYSHITKVGGSVAENTEILGSNLFLRSSVEYRQYWSRTLKEGEAYDTPRPVTAFRARYGNISGNVPFFEQFFVGGSNSLRGYDNQRFWGSQSFLATAEYRHPIQKSFNLVGFVDYGGAWNGYGRLKNFDQSDTVKLQLGYGLGAAFRTPLGPIRIDFGFSQEGKSKLHFSFGTSF